MQSNGDLRQKLDRRRHEQGLDKDPVPIGAVEPAEPVTLPCCGCDTPMSVQRGADATPLAIDQWNRWAPGAASGGYLFCGGCLDVRREQQAAAELERIAKQEEHRRERKAAEREQQEQARHDRVAEMRANMPAALASCGVPQRWAEASFGNCPDLPATLLAQAQEWASNSEGSLYLWGAVGAAKTWVAAAVLRDVLYQERFSPREVLFVTERGFLEGLKSEFGNREQGRQAAFGSVPLLVYDDLGSTRVTSWAQGEITGLVQDRHGGKLATVYTSNFDLDKIAADVDSRTASRIADGVTFIRFPDRDLRLTGALRPGSAKGGGSG